MPKESKEQRENTMTTVSDDGDSASEELTQKQRRRAKKMVKRLAALGLDEEGNELDNYSLSKYPVREWKFTLPGMKDDIALNPVVSLIGVGVLWGIVCWYSGKFPHEQNLVLHAANGAHRLTLRYLLLLSSRC
jgi:hypothetical protein